MTPGYLGLPTTEGKTARGASSPAKPALHMPENCEKVKVRTNGRGISSQRNLRHAHGYNFRGEGKEVKMTGFRAEG